MWGVSHKIFLISQKFWYIDTPIDINSSLKGVFEPHIGFDTLAKTGLS